MVEKVRLVIWDLDETFWSGTLTEGGMTLNEDNLEIVKSLAKRGIMSSICSKNDFTTVKDILEKAGIWEYFIFPSISWDAKGPRIAALIEDVQLRPATVMFIDDNPMNLNEALHFLPDIQISDEHFIPHILSNDLFKGKKDHNLSRLAQYKMLEKRKVDERNSSSGDNTEFLKTSEIRVIFNQDILSEIERGVELINRTNQLNFTKVRLSEDAALARSELIELVERPDVEANLIQVIDRYGDYGLVGFYAVERGKHNRLLHFCFSCRILNMGIETWLYRKLGSPEIEVVGEVLTDLASESRDVDWITIIKNDETAATTDAASIKPKFNRIIMRGGCEQRALAHYLAPHGISQVGEHNFPRHNIAFRIEHSMMMRHIVEGISGEKRDLFLRLGFTDEDMRSELLTAAEGVNLAVVSFWTDARMGMLRHKKTNWLIPYSPLRTAKLVKDANQSPEAKLAAQTVEGELVAYGYIKPEDYKENIRLTLNAIPSNFVKVFLLANTFITDADGNKSELPRAADYNGYALEALSAFPEVHIFDIRDFVESESEIHGGTHFTRPVHFRLANSIIERIADDKLMIGA